MKFNVFRIKNYYKEKRNNRKRKKEGRREGWRQSGAFSEKGGGTGVAGSLDTLSVPPTFIKHPLWKEGTQEAQSEDFNIITLWPHIWTFLQYQL